MTFSKQVTNDDFHYVYLHIINGLLRLTEKEILVLAEFLKLQEFYAKYKTYLDTQERIKLLFGPESRKDVQKKLNLSPYGLNNYIKTLKEKGAIAYNPAYNALTINPMIYSKKEGKITSVEFKLIDLDGN